MAARKDPSEKKDTEVVGATFSAVTVRRLDALVKDGSYGVTRPEVIVGTPAASDLATKGRLRPLRSRMITMT